MGSLKIHLYPDPILRIKGEAVRTFDADLHALLDNMRDTMYYEDGIGLAAPQVGVSKQIAVIDVFRDGTSYRELINPVVEYSAEKVVSEEGCLSIPGFRDKIMRSKAVRVTALDRHGNEYSLEGSELLGFCIQHEVDHLNGILFIDHLSTLKKQLFKSWLRKHKLEPEA